MRNEQNTLVEKKSLLHTADEAELASVVTVHTELNSDELVRVEGGYRPDFQPPGVLDRVLAGMIYVNRDGWTCSTFDWVHHGGPGSTAPWVPNY